VHTVIRDALLTDNDDVDLLPQWPLPYPPPPPAPKFPSEVLITNKPSIIELPDTSGAQDDRTSVTHRACDIAFRRGIPPSTMAQARSTTMV